MCQWRGTKLATVKSRPRWPDSATLLLSLFTSRFASAFLLNVPGLDPLVLAGVAAMLTVTSLAAMLGPAQRAARVEPLAALRAD